MNKGQFQEEPLTVVANRVYVMQHYLEQHLRDVEIRDLTQAFHRSQSSICRDFLKVEGLTPHDWLIRKRAETLKQVLADPKTQIKNLQDVIGLTVCRCQRLFKSTFGITMWDYRRQLGLPR